MPGHIITVLIQDEETESEEELDLPAKKEVCHDCQGHGTVLNESMRNHAYSAEEFQDSFDDDEQRHYFQRGGMYDVLCPTCKGVNVVDVIDREACDRDPKLKIILKRWDEQEEERARFDAMDRATERMERMAGC